MKLVIEYHKTAFPIVEGGVFYFIFAVIITKMMMF